MADERIKKYWSREMDALLETYEQFQTLLPSEKDCGAAHRGEDGRYVEHLVREYLRRYLPKDLEVLTGFILRPAVLCGKNNRSRKKDEHQISGQLDIIVYDTAHYPVYQRFGESIIALPEGVAAIFSVKKYLRPEYIEPEAESILHAARLCPHKLGNGKMAKSPFSALISIKDKYGEQNQIPLTKEEKGKKRTRSCPWSTKKEKNSVMMKCWILWVLLQNGGYIRITLGERKKPNICFLNMMRRNVHLDFN